MAGSLRSLRMTLLALVLGWTLTACGSTTKNDTTDTTAARTETGGTSTGTVSGTTPDGTTPGGTTPGGTTTPGGADPASGGTPVPPAPVGAGSMTSGGLTASTPGNIITRYESGGGKVCDLLTAAEAAAILGYKVTQEPGGDDNCTLIPASGSAKTLVAISMVTNPDMFERLTRGGEQLTGYGDKAMVKPPMMAILKGTKAVMISIANPTPAMNMKDLLTAMGSKIAARL